MTYQGHSASKRQRQDSSRSPSLQPILLPPQTRQSSCSVTSMGAEALRLRSPWLLFVEVKRARLGLWRLIPKAKA